MADREKIIRFFKASGDEELAARLLDLAEAALKSRKFKVTDFLDPHGINVAEIVAANVGNLLVQVEGGFLNAERVKVAFVAEDFWGTPDFSLEYFQVEWDKRYYELGHRDILGAFMGLGCQREVLGDIIFVPEGAQFVTDQSFNSYIESNLTQIGNAPVTLKRIAKEELLQKEEKVKVITATVAALRLDSVAAVGYGVSRSRMSEEIKKQNVKVNWKETKNGAQIVSVGDIISFRGRGRIELTEVKGTTKKGRISIVVNRYI
ncbi:MAG TPA: RNA-binding protein [Candidatus Avacidaminococcus intestinavium]|uniref:RNA-binding protein n=1 Tax=Candidatus Avacidaminococcus intestinavium TaxID=2840684 RepID=A0A9D1SKE3_9FIRM|nr:RNA-binding protein [Candidatus Avacidaminococcus intestinavium]